MMKLPKLSTNPLRSKKFRLIAGVVVVVLVLIAVLIWGVNTARASYRSSLKTQITDLNAFIAARGEKIQTDKTAATVLAALDETQKTLRDWKPAQDARVLGIDVSSAATKQAETDVKSQADKIVRIIDDVKALIAYQQAAVKPTEKLSGGKSQNLEQLKAAGQTWQANLTELEAIKPPEKAKAFHESLKQAVQGITADLVALPPLYEKQDVAGFNAKKGELDNKVGALQALGDQFAKLAKEQDVELTTQLHQLEHRLEDLTH